MIVAPSRTTENLQSWKERTREQLTLLNLHYAGVALLVLVNLYLLMQLAFAWQTATGQNAGAMAQQRSAMQAAETAAKPLQGLDGKLKLAAEDADTFYARRLPYADSQVVAELGALAKKQGVKLTRVQYAAAPVLQGSAGELTELRMDASLNGDYRPLVMFLNGLERDKLFFLIGGVTLTGQQSGAVGLRLRLTTYLRPAVGKEVTEKAALDNASDASNGGAPR